MGWLTWLQCAWAAIVLALAGERMLALFVRLSVSAHGLRYVTGALEQGDHEAAFAWARERPRTVIALLLLEAADGAGEGDLRSCVTELSHLSYQRLLALRVSATLSSVLGLLGGVVAIARGTGAEQGLLALQAGLSERLAMQDALFSMALGVGTAAVCFYALSRLRPRARELVTQLQRVSHLLLERAPAGGALTPAPNSSMRQALPRQ